MRIVITLYRYLLSLRLGIGLTGLIAENLICHPFIILRRQCQVTFFRMHRYKVLVLVEFLRTATVQCTCITSEKQKIIFQE